MGNSVSLPVPDVPPDSLQASTASEFFTAYFQALEAAHVPYVVLHGYEQYPKHIGSDVDYAVQNADLPQAARILHETCEAHDWAIAQIFRHAVYGYYFVAFNRRAIDQSIKLDVCSHYGRNFAFLLKDVDLLKGRRVRSGFYVPAPYAEFTYVLAKAFAKGKPLPTVAARLLELTDSDPGGCSAAFTRLTGFPAEKLKAICGGTLDADHWNQISRRVLRRHSGNPTFAAKEVYRRVWRFLQPTGLIVGVLGVDGSGKSTLLASLPHLLEPFFRRHHTLHFRPGFLGKRQIKTVHQPHALPPRSKPASWLKVLYYYTDWLLGYLCDLRLRIAHSTLVLCDRTFDDLVVDCKRYRLQTSSTLSNVLRRALPAPALLLVLVGPAEFVHARKPELSVAEIERQQQVLRSLAANDQCAQVVDAEHTPEEVAATCARKVLQLMAARCSARRGL
jgi:thymidylate kinase